MWRCLRLLFCLSLGLLSFGAHIAQAADSLTLVSNEPFMVSYRIQATPNTTYHLKLHFSQSSTQCQPDCSGETWDGTTWLGQTTAWQAFPFVATDAQGMAVGTLIGRAPDAATDGLLQLALRPDGGTVVTIGQTWAVSFVHPTHAVQVVHTEAVAPGSALVLTEGSGQRTLPLFSGAISFKTTGQAFSLQLRTPDGSLTSQQAYLLAGDGVYRILFPPAPVVFAHPALLLEKAHLFRGEVQHIHLTAQRPFGGAVDWYVDGVKQTALLPDLVITDALVGTHEVRAVLPATEESTIASFTVLPYTAIKIESLVPNPAGRDTGQERLVLHNNHDVPAILKSWHLRSRTTQSSIVITTTIPAGQSWELVGSNRLTNSGGTYDLLDDSGRLIDTVTYGPVAEGDRLSRHGLAWQGATSPLNQQSSHDAAASRVAIQGVVVAPKGKTFEVQPVAGPTVHVVIHPSFSGVKPRFHAGDSVRVTGVWQISKRGPYLSVRGGDVVELVSGRATTTPLMTKRRKPKIAVAAGIARAQAAESEGTMGVVSRVVPIVTPSSVFVHPPPWLNGLFALILTVGLVFVFSPSRKIPA